MSDTLHDLRQLRMILLRIGTARAGRYWSSAMRVFSSNMLGGVAAGAVASIFAAIIVGLDLHRGHDALVYRVVSDLKTLIVTIQTQIDRELR